jgi:hypothetical protein
MLEAGSETASPAFAIDPRHVFLTAKEVIVRYGWGRTYGYQMLKSTGFPAGSATRLPSPSRSPSRRPTRHPAGRLMARPRKDGKPAARAVRSGRERQTESGKRWRVRAYEPTAGAPTAGPSSSTRTPAT